MSETVSPHSREQKQGKHRRSLTRVIFISLFASLMAAILLISGILSSVFYQTSEKETERALVTHAEDLARAAQDMTEADVVQLLQEQVSGMERITLIDRGGNVVYDSKVPLDELGNHEARPEIEEAKRHGEAMVARVSQTLGTDVLYAAVSLSDGSIIRIAQARQSFPSFLTRSAGALIIVVALASLGAFVLARLLTKRIAKPIEDIDPNYNLAGAAYEEMRPLFERIDLQRRTLEEQNLELQEATEMRRNFSSNVTHELKSPLQVISGYAELIREGVAEGPDIERFAGLIEEEAGTMRKLIDDILTLSRLDESAMTEQKMRVDLKEITKRCIARLEPLALDRDITLSVQGSCGEVLGYPVLLENALYNLIENAIRYNRCGGQVEVTLEEHPAAESDGTAVTVSVHDTGIGIPREDLSKIFERFYRIDESRSRETGGTGLGLAIVKHAIEVHGGTIQATSTEGKGSTFEIRFEA